MESEMNHSFYSF